MDSGCHRRSLRGWLAQMRRCIGATLPTRTRDLLTPRLAVLELEDRRVLSGTSISVAGTLVIDADYAAALVNDLDSGNVSLSADEIRIESAVDASSNTTSGTSLELHAATITFSNGADLVTKQGDLLLDGSVVLENAANILLSSGPGLGGGNVSVLGTIDGSGGAGNQGLSLLSGTGMVTLAGAVGASDAIGSLTVVQSSSAAIGAANVAGAMSVCSTGAVALGGEVHADGGITVHASSTTITDDLVTDGASILIDGSVALVSSETVTLDTTNAGHSAGNDVSLGSVAGGTANLTVQAGEGNILLTGTVDSIGTLELDSTGDTRILGRIGDTDPVGRLTTDAGGTTYIDASITTSGGTQVYDDAVVLTNHTTLTDTGTTGILFNNTVDGDANGPWNLTVVTTNPLAQIEFNDAVGSGHLIGTVTVLNAGLLTIGADADFTLEGSFLQTGTGAVRTAGDMAAVDVQFFSAVTLTGDISIQTHIASGDIRFQNTVDGVGLDNLTLAAGSGDIVFANTVGGAVPLAAITIQSARDVTFQGTVTAASLVEEAGEGTITLCGDVTTNAAEGVDLTSPNVVLDGLTITTLGDGVVRFDAAVGLTGDVTIDSQGPIRFESTLDSPGGAAHRLTLSSQTDIGFFDDVGLATAGALGAVVISHADNVEVAGSLNAASLVQVAGWGTTTLAGDITTSAAQGVDVTAARVALGSLTIVATGSGIVRFNAPVELHGDATIDAEGSIAFERTLESPGSLAEPLRLGSDADIFFRDSVGDGPGNALGALTITTARDVEADGVIVADSLVQLVGSGTTTLTDDVTTTASEGIDLTAARIVLDGLTLAAEDGGSVRINGPVQLGDNVSIEATDGDILFTTLGTIDGHAGQPGNLTLTAGAGSVSFNADIGGLQPIGSLTVIQADGGVTFGGEGGGDYGPVAMVSSVGKIDLGSETTILDGIALNAGDGNVISFITAGGEVRFNGHVVLQSDAFVDTGNAGALPGGEIRFTRQALIDSQDGEQNGLSLDAGADGVVRFNADIGSAVALGHLEVVTAGGVSFGNDTRLSDPDLGPVTLVRVDGSLLPAGSYAIDLGSGAPIGEAGIVLNAGEDGVMEFVTTGRALRLNGAVVLQSDASIDTSDRGNEAGAEIRFTRDATIDSASGESNGLTFTAGTDGAVSFNADIGSTAALGWLIVTDAWGVSFGNDVSGADPDLSPLTTVRVNGNAAFPPTDYALDIGSLTPIGDGGIALNGGAGSTLSLVTTADRVRMNGIVELQSDVWIDTSDAGTASGAEIRFTQIATIDSEPGEANGLTLSAGIDGVVDFNADIGTVAALGHLIVTEALGVALGSGSNLSDADLGPVTAVWVDGDAPADASYALDIGSVSAIGAGGIVLDGGGPGSLISLFTTADGVHLNGAVRLRSDALIDTTGEGIETTGADILVEGTIDGTAAGAEGLTLISHTGAITVTGSVGAETPFDTLTLQDDLPDSTGPAVFLGEVHANALATFGQEYLVALLGGGSVEDAVEFLNTGGVTLGDTPEDDLTFGQGATSIASETSLGGTIRALDQDIQFAAVHVIADTRLVTAGGNIGFAGPIDSDVGEHFDLEIAAGSGVVEFNGDIGNTWPLNRLVVDSADSVVFGGSSPLSVVTADGGIDLGRMSAVASGIFLNGGSGGELTVGTSGGVIRFNGAVTLQSDVVIDTTVDGEPLGADICFTLHAPINSDAGQLARLTLTAGDEGAVCFNANIGDGSLGTGEPLKQLIVTAAKGVVFGNDGAADDPDLAPVTLVRIDGDPLALDAFAIDLGSVTPIGDDGVVANAGDGDTIQIITTGDRVRINGPVELRSDARIDTSDSGSTTGAEIRFTLNAPIDSQYDESNRLTLSAGEEGRVTFNGDIGTREAPGALIVTDASGVVFGGESLPDFAPLSTVRVGGDPLDPDTFYLDIGQNTPIGSDGIVLNGGHDLDGEPLTLTIASAGGAMRFNGAVSLWSDVHIDTTDAESSFGSQIRFTQYAAIDSQDGEQSDLILTAGEGSIEFNADLGSQQSLDRLEITIADGGVVFGASDEPEASGDGAPVTAIRADGGIDLGSLAVLAEGIVFNAGLDAGDEQVLTIVTDGAGVRVNGPVTLASHLTIDSGSSPDGSILFTDDSPVDCAAGEMNDLVLDAGEAGIEFNADIGAEQPLGRLEVTQADGGVVFGGADAPEGDLGDGGPVSHIVVVSGIDVGSQKVVVDGIVFNAGPGQELSLYIEDGGARLNGPVWLWSDLVIDTSSAGGDVAFTTDATIDSQIGEHNSLRLDAGAGGVYINADVGMAGPGDHRIGNLAVERSGTIDEHTDRIQAFGDILFVSSGNVTIREMSSHPHSFSTVTGDTITIRARGLLTIENGAALQSNRGAASVDTGQVSNAPPVFRPDPDDPYEVLVPGQRVHTINGTMGGQTGLGDNLERGYNFTLNIYWSDLKSTVIRHIHAGDHIDLFVDENGQGEPVITHRSNTGPITFSLRREYSLAYLETIETTVETWLVMANDPKIVLNDSRTVDLNETSAVRGIKVAADQFHYSEPIPEYLQPAPLQEPGQFRAIAEAPTVPLDEKSTRQEELRPASETGVENQKVWYLVRVLPRGAEVEKIPIPEEIAADPVRLFQRLKEIGLPDGRYRVYLEELGFPRRMVYEFYKSGNSFGDPVRERGPGSNPIQQPAPQSGPKSQQGAFVGPIVPEMAIVDKDGVGEDIVAAGSSRHVPWAAAEDGHALPASVLATLARSPLLGDIGSTATVIAALGAWRHGTSHRPRAWRVDEAMAECSGCTLTRTARLRRRLKASIRSIRTASRG